jgi:hypothetical protein
VLLLEQAGSYPFDPSILDPEYSQLPSARLEPTDHGDGGDCEVRLAHYAAGSTVRWPSSLYLSERGEWHVWDGETNEEREVVEFKWRQRRSSRGWAFCALGHDGKTLTPYLHEEQEATDG